MNIQTTIDYDFNARAKQEADQRLFEAVIKPEVVRHPHCGWCHAIPVPGTSCRVYEGWWHLKRHAEAAFYQRFPHLQPRPRISKARTSSVPLPLPHAEFTAA